MSQVIQNDPFDPDKIFQDLVNRCMSVRKWSIRALVSEFWTGTEKVLPQTMIRYIIEDGIYTFDVIASSRKDALILIADNVPIIKFLEDENA